MSLQKLRPLSEFHASLQFLLTDIDDTLTDEGRLTAPAYQALWDLHDAGIQVVPITGRPAGWCEMIARQWPVAGVVGENGGFYFRSLPGKMKRHFVTSESDRKKNREKLKNLEAQILKTVPGCAVASDQFCRMLDLAIDFCEDVKPLPAGEVDRIVALFEQEGAQAKVSSIHVNGWFGTYNKNTEALFFLQEEFGMTPEQAKKVCGFSGDSPNDEPMWEYFPHGFAVANIQAFKDRLIHRPSFVASQKGGLGFRQIADQILAQHKSV